VPAQQGAEFVLEGLLFVVFLLVIDVGGYGVDVEHGNGETPASALPEKFGN
jgi:hypothetical protein